MGWARLDKQVLHSEAFVSKTDLSSIRKLTLCLLMYALCLMVVRGGKGVQTSRPTCRVPGGSVCLPLNPSYELPPYSHHNGNLLNFYNFYLLTNRQKLFHFGGQINLPITQLLRPRTSKFPFCFPSVFFFFSVKIFVSFVEFQNSSSF